jgi:coenzyme F420-reducing hydrogenase delta subunit
MKDLSIKITLFYCSNSISAEEISNCTALLEDIELNTISLPCSGKMNLLYLLKTIETGSEGAVLMTCKFGECKFVQGNFRAHKRVESVDDLIFETGIGRGHVRCIQIEG